LTFCTCAGCILAILIIAAQQTSSERTVFAINFVITVCQDLFVTPIISVIVIFFFIFLWKNIKRIKKSPALEKIVKNSIGHEALALDVIRIFVF
jgi:hypothetical protein